MHISYILSLLLDTKAIPVRFFVFLEMAPTHLNVLNVL